MKPPITAGVLIIMKCFYRILFFTAILMFPNIRAIFAKEKMASTPNNHRYGSKQHDQLLLKRLEEKWGVTVKVVKAKGSHAFRPGEDIVYKGRTQILKPRQSKKNRKSIRVKPYDEFEFSLHVVEIVEVNGERLVVVTSQGKDKAMSRFKNNKNNSNVKKAKTYSHNIDDAFVFSKGPCKPPQNPKARVPTSWVYILRAEDGSLKQLLNYLYINGNILLDLDVSLKQGPHILTQAKSFKRYADNLHWSLFPTLSKSKLEASGHIRVVPRRGNGFISSVSNTSSIDMLAVREMLTLETLIKSKMVADWKAKKEHRPKSYKDIDAKGLLKLCRGKTVPQYSHFMEIVNETDFTGQIFLNSFEPPVSLPQFVIFAYHESKNKKPDYLGKDEREDVYVFQQWGTKFLPLFERSITIDMKSFVLTELSLASKQRRTFKKDPLRERIKQKPRKPKPRRQTETPRRSTRQTPKPHYPTEEEEVELPDEDDYLE